MNLTFAVNTDNIKYNVLGTASEIIRLLSYEQQYITADDIQRELRKHGFTLGDIGNTAGSFFRGNPFVVKLKNVVVRSNREGRNGSLIGVYESLAYGGIRLTHYDFVGKYNAKAKKATA